MLRSAGDLTREKMEGCYAVVDLPSRGKGCIAKKNFLEHEDVLVSIPDIAVLYTPFTLHTCARCFKDVTGMKNAHTCTNCNRFFLCPECLNIDGLISYHSHECKLFCSISEGMRNGDTDYLRFVLRYFSILQYGPPPGSGTCQGATNRFKQLCNNRSTLPKTYLAWCAQFAVLFTKSFPFPPGFTPSNLVDLFCILKSNSLGFPFNNAATMGWCLDVRASMFNHSCAPNCYVTGGPNGEMVVKTKRSVSTDEELCISYVDLLLDEFKDTKTRRDHLFESYCFWCNCEKCSQSADNKQ